MCLCAVCVCVGVIDRHPHNLKGGKKTVFRLQISIISTGIREVDHKITREEGEHG